MARHANAGTLALGREAIRLAAKPTLLFTSMDLGTFLDARMQQAAKCVKELNANYLLNVSEADLVAKLVQRYGVEPLTLQRDGIEADEPVECEIDVGGLFQAAGRTFGPGKYSAAITTIHVPLNGTIELLACRPRTFNYSPPQAVIGDAELLFEFRQIHADGSAITSELNRALADIQQYINWQSGDVVNFSKGLGASVGKLVTQRKQAILRNRDMVSSLGFKIRARDVAATYAPPSVRRKPKIELPNASSAPFTPEPAITLDDYEYILRVIENMTHVIELSPKSFATMGEEDLRTHFLVQLNGHFEGAATGETFNFEGKTDILIRHEGRNLFIAECKFWAGGKQLLETIDQLLGYTSWRDTKSAIIIFNRNKGFSGVLEKVPAVVAKHPNFKREIGRPSETQFRFVLHHKQDINRELYLALLCFDVPK